MELNDKIVIYRTEDGQTAIDVKLEQDTVWLSANQMSTLFDRDEKTIRKHINNVFAENELERENNTHFLRVDGVKQPVAFYSLDVIFLGCHHLCRISCEKPAWYSVPHLGQQSAERLSDKGLCRQQSPDRAAVFRIKAAGGSSGPDGTKRIADNGKYCSGLVLQYFDKQILTNAARAFRTFLILLKAHALIIT